MKILYAVLCLVVAGCNSYQVRPLPYDPNLKEVVVVRNPAVRVSDFLDVLEDNFNARGIKVCHVESAAAVKENECFITYDALRSWDFAPYLADANLRVHKDRMIVAKGHYHHVGRSASLDVFTKWRGTEWKMSELYNHLLRQWDEKR